MAAIRISLAALQDTLHSFTLDPIPWQPQLLEVISQSVDPDNWESGEDIVAACKILTESAHTNAEWRELLKDRFTGDILSLCSEGCKAQSSDHKEELDAAAIVKQLCGVVGARDFHMACMELLRRGDCTFSAHCPLLTVGMCTCLPQLNTYFTTYTYEMFYDELTKCAANANETSGAREIVQGLFHNLVRFCDEILLLFTSASTSTSCKEDILSKNLFIYRRDATIGFMLKILHCVSQSDVFTSMDISNCVAEVICVVHRHGDIDCLVMHPYRVRYAMNTLYGKVCQTRSFQRQHKQAAAHEDLEERQSMDRARTSAIEKESEVQARRRVTHFTSLLRTAHALNHSYISDGASGSASDGEVASIPWDAVTDQNFIELMELYDEHCGESTKSIAEMAQWNSIHGDVWNGVLYHETCRWMVSATVLVAAAYSCSSTRPQVYSSSYLWHRCWPLLSQAFLQFPSLYQSSNMKINVADTEESNSLAEAMDHGDGDHSSEGWLSYIGLRLLCCMCARTKLQGKRVGGGQNFIGDMEYSEFAAASGSSFWKKDQRDHLLREPGCSGNGFGCLVSRSHDVLSIVQLVINAISACGDQTLVKSCVTSVRSLLDLMNPPHRICLLRRVCNDCPFRQLAGVLIDYVKDCFQTALVEFNTISHLPVDPQAQDNEIALQDIASNTYLTAWLRCTSIEDCDTLVYSAVEQAQVRDETFILAGLLGSYVMPRFGAGEMLLALAVPMVLRDFVFPKLNAYRSVRIDGLISNGSDELLSTLSLIAAIGCFASSAMQGYIALLQQKMPEKTLNVLNQVISKDIIIKMLEYTLDRTKLIGERLESELAKKETCGRGKQEGKVNEDKGDSNRNQIMFVLFSVGRAADSVRNSLCSIAGIPTCPLTKE